MGWVGSKQSILVRATVRKKGEVIHVRLLLFGLVWSGLCLITHYPGGSKCTIKAKRK
ncbi:hypothetical protein BO71DRAFT_18902 [Aspergillus ellipticus CBS 707.79]|uniref:Uncharacterized protein n=1 Tax=Aspergillus ellipticus CBS 707.79 TaxID=1448320 RepID=A0A319D5S6_9EURO|nr:hypothetical protein BO71DRAFT_18902 [Aspergillus ellipticus CBS 707.79]